MAVQCMKHDSYFSWPWKAAGIRHDTPSHWARAFWAYSSMSSLLLMKFNSPQSWHPLFWGHLFCDLHIEGTYQPDYCYLYPSNKYLLSAYTVLGSVLGNAEQKRCYSHGLLQSPDHNNVNKSNNYFYDKYCKINVFSD